MQNKTRAAPGPGFVFLSAIREECMTASHWWDRYPGDKGNGRAAACPERTCLWLTVPLQSVHRR